MIQIFVLSGKKAGCRSLVRHFPFRVGRGPENDFLLDDDGVWNHHFQIEMTKKEGFVLATAPNAIAAINAVPAERAQLRIGDTITVGSAKIQFWLAPASLSGRRPGEFLAWFLLFLVSACQVLLLCWLLKSD